MRLCVSIAAPSVHLCVSLFLSFFPSYCLLSSFKAIVEDEAEVAGEKGKAETNVDLTASKPSLASATEVEMDVAETQYACNLHTGNVQFACTIHGHARTVCFHYTEKHTYTVLMQYTPHRHDSWQLRMPASCTQSFMAALCLYLLVLLLSCSYFSFLSCREGFDARREKAKMLRQQSQEHPPNPRSLLRDEAEVNYRG